jgi:ankyrin repeat protein
MGEIIRSPYVILGHGSENINQTPPKVPKECLLIVSEECGILGTLPDYIYEVLSNPDYKELFEHPEDNLDELQRLFQKPLRLYRPGDPYPNMSYTVFNDDRDPSDTNFDPKTVEVYISGVQPLPIPEANLTLNPVAAFPESLRVTTYSGSMDPHLLIKMYKGSIFPDEKEFEEHVIERTTQNATGRPGFYRWSDMKINAKNIPSKFLKISQKKLFEVRKGIYYMFLCRQVQGLENVIKESLTNHFPQREIKSLLQSGWNAPATVFDWIQGKRQAGNLTAKQQQALNATQESLMGAIRKRQASRTRHKLPPPSNTIKALRILHMNERSRTALRPRLSALLSTADLTAVEPQTGDTLLMLAAEQGNTPSVEYLRTRMDLNQQNYAGITAVMAAAESGKRAIVQTLLNAGSDPTLRSKNGTTLLHLLAEDDAGDLVARVLAMPGVDATAVTAKGETVLHAAAKYDSIAAARILGAAHPELFTAKTIYGETPFHVACKNHSAAVAKLCLKARVNPNEKDGNGKSGLLLALEHEEDPDEEHVPDIYRTLVANGVSLEDPAILKTAIYYELDAIATFLLERGARVVSANELREAMAGLEMPTFSAAFAARYGSRHVYTRRRRFHRRKTRRRHRG